MSIHPQALVFLQEMLHAPSWTRCHVPCLGLFWLLPTSALGVHKPARWLWNKHLPEGGRGHCLLLPGSASTIEPGCAAGWVFSSTHLATGIFHSWCFLLSHSTCRHINVLLPTSSCVFPQFASLFFTKNPKKNHLSPILLDPLPPIIAFTSPLSPTWKSSLAVPKSLCHIPSEVNALSHISSICKWFASQQNFPL